MDGISLKFSQESITRLKQEYAKLISDLESKKVNIDFNSANKEINDLKNQLNSLIRDISKINLSNKLNFDVKGTVGGIEQAIQAYKELGNINIKNKIFDPETESLKSFTLELKQADGMISKLKYNSSYIAGNEGNLIPSGQFNLSALSQTDTTAKVAEQLVKEENQLANSMAKVREQSELSAKESNSQNELNQAKAINKALDDEYNENLKLAEAIAKAREQSELRRKEEEKTAGITQSKASNKALDEQYQAQLSEQKRIANLGEVKTTFDPSLLQKSNSEIKDYVQNLYGADAKIVSFKKSMDEAGNSIVKMTVNTKNNKNEIQQEKVVLDQVTSSIYKQEEAVKANTARMVSFGDRIKNAWVAVASFATVTGAFYGAIRQLQQGIQIINDLNAAETNISMITGMGSDKVKELTKSYSELATQLHDTTTNVMQASQEFLRAGNSEEQTNALVKASTVMSKIAGQSQEESAQSLIAIMNAFHMNADDMMGVVDKMVAIDNTSATSTSELSKALQKASSSAQEAGVNFNQLLSYIGTISSVTRQAPESIGTSLNSIFSRYENVKSGAMTDENGESVNNVEAVLNQIGISIRTTDNQFRGFNDVLTDLVNKWGTLNQVEQNAATTAMAGTRQRNQFLALIQNQSMALNQQATATNSAGNAMVRYGEYEKSTAAKMSDLTNTIQKMWMGMINSNEINGVISVTTSLIKTFGNLHTILLAVGTALLIFKGKAILDFFTSLPTSISKSITSLNLFKQISVAIEMQQAGMITTNQAVSASFAALGTSIKTAFLSNPLGWIAIGITTVISVLDIFNQKAEDTKQKIANLTNEMSNLNADEKLIESYKQIQEQLVNTNKTAPEYINLQNQILDTQKQLAQAMPSLVDGYTKEGDAIVQNTKALDAYIATKKASVLAEAGSTYQDLQKELTSQDKYMSIDAQANHHWYDDLLGAFDDKSYMQDALEKPQSLIEQYNEALVKAQDFANKGNLDEASKYAGVVKDTEEKIKSLNEAAIQLYSIGQKDVQIYDFESKSMVKYSDYLAENTTEVNKNTDAKKDNADATDYFAKTGGDLQKQFEDTSNSLKSLNQIIADQNNEQDMSADQVMDLITKYPQLASAITSTANGYVVEKSALETLRQAKIAEMNTTLDAQANNAKATLQSAQSQLSAFGIIIEGIKTLQDAQVAASKVSTTYQLIQSGLPPMLAAKQQAENDALRSQIIDYGNLLNRINALKGLASSPSYGVSNYYSSNNKSAEDAAKKAEQAQQDAYSAIDDINGKLMEAIKAQVEEEKKALDERLNNYKNFIDEKLKALDDEYTAEDRKRKLDEENKKKADLQAQRDALLADSSDEAKSLRNSLQEQIDAQQQTIDDLNRDYSREDQKANLNKQLADFEKQINDQKSALDEKYSDEEIAKLAKNGLLSGLVSIGTQSMSVKDLLLEAMQKSGEAFTATGQKLQTELIDKLLVVQQLMQNMNGDGTISGNVALNVLGSHADGAKIYKQGLYELHPNEWVVNSTQGNILDKIVKNDYSFLRNFKVDVPNIPAMNTNSAGGIQIGSIIGTVQGNVDRTTLPMLEKIVKDNLPQVVAEARMNSDKKLGNYNARVK